jgi:hypothetical protein
MKSKEDGDAVPVINARDNRSSAAMAAANEYECTKRIHTAAHRDTRAGARR